ncbi:hypothetical protein HDU84_000446 [Entophlyctis sp. JEL0112]|nr:hypothetical protein HDU84_000446 [Entophlyctis sp. JEL0112]
MVMMIVSLASIWTYKDTRYYTLRPKLKEYVFSHNKTVVIRGQYYNIYIRLRREVRSGEQTGFHNVLPTFLLSRGWTNVGSKPYYHLLLGGYEIDARRISGSSTELELRKVHPEDNAWMNMRIYGEGAGARHLTNGAHAATRPSRRLCVDDTDILFLFSPIMAKSRDKDGAADKHKSANKLKATSKSATDADEPAIENSAQPTKKRQRPTGSQTTSEDNANTDETHIKKKKKSKKEKKTEHDGQGEGNNEDTSKFAETKQSSTSKKKKKEKKKAEEEVEDVEKHTSEDDASGARKVVQQKKQSPTDDTNTTHIKKPWNDWSQASFDGDEEAKARFLKLMGFGKAKSVPAATAAASVIESSAKSSAGPAASGGKLREMQANLERQYEDARARQFGAARRGGGSGGGGGRGNVRAGLGL